MNLSTIIYTALNPFFANGIWPGKASEDIQPPFGVFLHFGPTIVRLDGRSPMQNQRVQIDIWASTYDECSVIADQVEANMDLHSLNSSPSTFTATQLTRQFFPPDAETHLQRIMLEFSVWYIP